MGIPSNPPQARFCRADCRKVESLSHVLQGCLLQHWARGRIHDRVCSRLRRLAESKGWMVVEEQRLNLQDGQLRKPDLILPKGSTVVVCDVAVSWEGPRSLGAAYEQKILYYSQPAVMEALQRRYPGKEIRVTSLVLGARGTWCPRNGEVARLLGLTRRQCSTLVTNVINGGQCGTPS